MCVTSLAKYDSCFWLENCFDVIKIEVARQCNTFKEFSPALLVGTENMRRKSDWLPGTDQIRQIGRFNWNFGSIHSRRSIHPAVLSRVIAGINATTTFRRSDYRSIADKPSNEILFTWKKNLWSFIFQYFVCSSIFISCYFLS